MEVEVAGESMGASVMVSLWTPGGGTIAGSATAGDRSIEPSKPEGNDEKAKNSNGLKGLP
jgi:hypothetical protein